MRVLFTHSYFLRLDAKQWKQQQPYPPLATIQAAAFIRDNKYEVELFDVMFEKEASAVIETINKFKPDFFVVYDDGFNYLTKMCLTNMREAAFEMIAHAKKAGCKIIVSSSDSTDHSENYLKAGADFIIIGEAELTLKELLDDVSNDGNNCANIRGLAYFENNKLIKTAPREILKELDSLPLPAWDLVGIEKYRSAWEKSTGYFSINVFTTRGCPFKCNWCAKPIYGNRYNARSPELVVKEIKLLKENYGIEHVWFCDDIFGLKPGWIKKFSGLMQKNNLLIPFKIQCRVDLLLEEENIKHLADAGCDEVWVGAESGSQKILDAMDKGTTVSQIYDATANLRKHKIKPCFFIQFGYLGETLDDIKQTIKMVMDLMPYHIGVSVSYPLPGTKFFEKVKDELKSKSNWSDSDELVLMFKNTYQPQFYKILHRYLHQVYRSKQSAQILWALTSGKEKWNKRNVLNVISLPVRIPLSFFYQIRLKMAGDRNTSYIF
ncbi:MAG TPA: radical SAM protein [Bacteroidia bacterium]|nr:radical SAM protein [Bacteroidia bacterium]HNU34882.1 radical SAM protein [Bacteroidia bacterium]